MNQEIKKIRNWLALFIAALVISGATAIPVEAELDFLSRFFSINTATGKWITTVNIGISNANNEYPFLLYGYDWLAFAHFVLAILFIGPYKDPVRNKWVIEFGMYCCLLVLPYAFIAGYFRGIPIGWRLVDCLFGIVGLIPLLIVYKLIRKLEEESKKDNEDEAMLGVNTRKIISSSNDSIHM